MPRPSGNCGTRFELDPAPSPAAVSRPDARWSRDACLRRCETETADQLARSPETVAALATPMRAEDTRIRRGRCSASFSRRRAAVRLAVARRAESTPGLGDTGPALDWLEKAAERAPRSRVAGVRPVFDALHPEGRFAGAESPGLACSARSHRLNAPHAPATFRGRPFCLYRSPDVANCPWPSSSSAGAAAAWRHRQRTQRS